MGSRGPQPGDKAKTDSGGKVIQKTKPKAATWLCADGKKLFRKIGRQLEANLIDIDSLALSRYCRAAVRYKEAKLMMGCVEVYYEAENGLIKQHPLVRELKELSLEMSRLENELCMSPAARTRARLDVEDPNAQNEVETTSLLD